MSQELIISVSGMRGIIGENLTPSLAADYGCAFGSFLRRKYTGIEKLTVCIGRDSRRSGEMLKAAVCAGLAAVGIDTVDVGIVSTPGVGIMLRELECIGGVVITASHNPIQYNGIKLLLDNGIAPAPNEAEQIKKLLFDRNFTYTESRSCGKISFNENACDTHVNKVLEILDKQKIKSAGLKVVLDSVNGAGGAEGVMLLEQLGCEVVKVNTEPTGEFAHTPEPTEENLTGLCEQVKKTNSALGFAQDPDADRLAIVDENGKYIGEEYTLALAAKYVLSKQKGAAAANLSTSRMIDDIAADAGCKVFRTPVGEANVAAAMMEQNCVIGGEGNGGIIDLRIGAVRDSLVGMGLILNLTAESGKTISELVGQIPSYCILKDKVAADKQQAQQVIELVKGKLTDAKINTADGCRFDLNDGWIHLRTSNTEPIMRVIVEAETEQSGRRYFDMVQKICKDVVK
jgi:phosphomannomutase